jgi:selenocysteine lyase/cysteine desulfurase
VAEILGTEPGHLYHDPGVSMATVPLPKSPIESKEQARALQGELADRGVEAVVTPWTGGALRLSAHVYNQLADYERLGVAVRDCLTH